MVSGDLQSTLAFQWAVIRHNGSKLALSELFGSMDHFFSSHGIKFAHSFKRKAKYWTSNNRISDDHSRGSSS